MWEKKAFAVWIIFMMDLTGGLSALAHLKLHASVELSGDQTIGNNHHHTWDEEQSEQQQHIPEKQPEWEEKGINHKENLTTESKFLLTTTDTSDSLDTC